MPYGYSTDIMVLLVYLRTGLIFVLYRSYGDSLTQRQHSSISMDVQLDLKKIRCMNLAAIDFLDGRDGRMYLLDC